MKHIIQLFLFTLVILIPLEAHAMHASFEATTPEVAEFADAFFSENMINFQVPGATLVVVKGEQVIYSQGYGYAHLEEKIPVSPDETIFRAGSVSKLFTATALMQLYERGQLDLHADINTYLTRFQVQSPDGSPVTTAQLLTHTAGFEENYFGMHTRTPEKLIPLGDFLANHLPPIISQPGTVISYNDHGMSLAGFLVEEITGVPFEQYLMEEILVPLGMTSSTFDQIPPPAIQDRLAIGYRYQNGTYAPYPIDFVNVAPAASLLSSSNDVAHFIIAQLNDGIYKGERILSPDTIALMQAQQFSHHSRLRGRAYGFSEWIENNQRALFHDGGNPGFMSRLMILPEHGVGFFIAINGDRQSKAPRLLREFTSQFLDTFFPEVEDQVPDPIPPADFATRTDKYTGYYRELAGYSSTTLTKLASLLSQVSVKKGADNTLTIGSGTAIEVEPLVFRWQGSDSYAVFREDAGGQVDFLFYGTGAFQKLAWYETQPFQFVLVILFILGFISMITTGIFAKSFKPLTRGFLVSIGLFNLVFLLGIGLALLNMDQWNIFYGLPLTLKLLLVLPIITTLLTIGLLVLSGASWITGENSLVLRSLVTLLTLLAVGFIPFMNYWNLLGFKQ